MKRRWNGRLWYANRCITGNAMTWMTLPNVKRKHTATHMHVYKKLIYFQDVICQILSVCVHSKAFDDNIPFKMCSLFENSHCSILNWLTYSHNSQAIFQYNDILCYVRSILLYKFMLILKIIDFFDSFRKCDGKISWTRYIYPFIFAFEHKMHNFINLFGIKEVCSHQIEICLR